MHDLRIDTGLDHEQIAAIARCLSIHLNGSRINQLELNQLAAAGVDLGAVGAIHN